MELLAPSLWQCVDFISDLHLQASDQDTFHAWSDYLHSTPADAVFILGNLFEVWVGDDAVLPTSFESECVSVLRAASARLAVYIMQGNRDFLMGPSLMQACQATAIDDPSVLTFAGQRWLLSHGDALCVDDHEYQTFRLQVRSAEWQTAFLQKPLEERQAIARGIRNASENRKQNHLEYADVDTQAALDLLRTANSFQLIHGHTHKPAHHALDSLHTRTVLSDWDMQTTPPRAEILRLNQNGTKTRLPAVPIASAQG